jgi:hypothetical protein
MKLQEFQKQGAQAITAKLLILSFKIFTTMQYIYVHCNFANKFFFNFCIFYSI